MEPKGSFNFKLIWGIFMVMIYVTMAVILVFTDIFAMGKTFRIIIGVLFFLYGMIRGLSIWKYGK